MGNETFHGNGLSLQVRSQALEGPHDAHITQRSVLYRGRILRTFLSLGTCRHNGKQRVAWGRETANKNSNGVESNFCSATHASFDNYEPLALSERKRLL